MQITSKIIGAASGWGAQLRATEKGPVVFKDMDPLKSLHQVGIEVIWPETLYPLKRAVDEAIPVGRPSLPLVREMADKIAQSVRKTLEDQKFPCVIGGDHSIAIGTWSGVTTSLGARENFGLLWIDAHMDAHTYETSPSKAYHGMPLAALMGYGENEFLQIGSKGPKIAPRHAVLMGIRSFEQEEETLLQKLGVRIYRMDEIQRKGFGPCLEEALEILTKGTKGFGVSIDLDAFDPLEAPGVGSPAPHGLRQDEVLPHLHKIREREGYTACEITEYNPELDIELKTAQLALRLLKRILPQREGGTNDNESGVY